MLRRQSLTSTKFKACQGPLMTVCPGVCIPIAQMDKGHSIIHASKQDLPEDDLFLLSVKGALQDILADRPAQQQVL